jgi:uncharacterized repeat protein (TIGR03803 family)
MNQLRSTRFESLRRIPAVSALGLLFAGGCVFGAPPETTPTYTVLNNFQGGGYYFDNFPGGQLALGQDGNLYGTSDTGQSNIFQMTPAGIETLLWESGEDSGDGCVWSGHGNFFGGLTLGSDGTLYGECASWGFSGNGVYIGLNGGEVSVLHAFRKKTYNPNPLLLGPDGNLYGTTYNGGTADDGMVFKLTPDGVLTASQFSGSRSQRRV